MKQKSSIGEVLRSCQRAFLFNINSNVKSITIKKADDILSIRAFFCITPSKDDCEMITNAGGEVYGDSDDIKDWVVECFPSSDFDDHLDNLIYARAY